MNRAAWIVALMLVSTSSTRAAPAAPQAMPGWLAGCWQQIEGERWTEECWTTPRGGIQLGSGRNGRSEKLSGWETMQIARGSDGSLTFYGSPQGAPRVAFPLITQTAREVVFANPAHDFPQRIRYWRDGEALKAEIALLDGTKAIGFTYRRAR